jgi:hypothetical protein
VIVALLIVPEGESLARVCAAQVIVRSGAGAVVSSGRAGFGTPNNAY